LGRRRHTWAARTGWTLLYLRGQRSIYDPARKRELNLTLIDFDNPDANLYHVTAAHNDDELLQRYYVRRQFPFDAAQRADAPSSDEDAKKKLRKAFVKPEALPKILIVTDKLLTGFDAPILYCMFFVN
jgi:type I site-specific restriction-modification system R (restriction) subunit